MRIIFKLPTRGRVAQADRMLDELRRTQGGGHEVEYLVVGDLDDPDFSGAYASWLAPDSHCVVTQTMSACPPVKRIAGRHFGKFDAANAHTPPLDTFDIIIAGSDDLWPVLPGWDDQIAQDMQRLYPALDGVLWYHDGHNDKVPAYPIYGREALRRFGGDLWPRCYKSIYGDDEVRDRAQAMGILGDMRSVTLFEHRHPAWGKAQYDEVYRVNDRLNEGDRLTYERRKAEGFPVDAEGRAI